MKKVMCMLILAMMVFMLSACGINDVAIEKVEMNGYSMSPLGQNTCLDIENYQTAISDNDFTNIGNAGSTAIADVESPLDYYADIDDMSAFEVCTRRNCVYTDKANTVTPLTYSTGIELNN